jgi:two-component system OmpR family sensor kinase
MKLSAAAPYVLVGCVVLATVVGAVLASGLVSQPLIAQALHARTTLWVLGGVLLFGAGLLNVSAWQIEDDPRRAPTGACLVAFGVLAPVSVGLGPVLHDTPAAVVLSPFATALAAAAAVVAGLAGTGAVGGARLRPRLLAGGMLGALLVLVTAPMLLRLAPSLSLDPPAWLHTGVEASVALLWLSVAAVNASRAADTDRVPLLGNPVLLALSAVWVLRMGAVIEVTPWTVAASGLLAAIGMVVLAVAVADFLATTDSERSRRTTAEEALETVAEAFSSLDQQRRSMAHDAHNVLFALRTASRTLVDHGDNLDPEVRQRLRLAIAQEVDHLHHMLVRPADSGAGGVDLVELVDGVVALERLHGLEVRVDLPGCRVGVQPEALTRVFRNLLVNARTHAPGSAVTIRGWVADGRLRVLVSDDGPGIPAEMRRQAFGRAVTRVGSAGSGVGLHVSRALMHQQGGSLELVEQQGPGACFALTVPLTPAMPGQRSGRTAEPVSA